MSPDEESSWFEPGPESSDFIEVNDLEADLRCFFDGRGCQELAALAPELVKLSKSLEIREQDSADLSPFIYVMY